MLRNADPRTLLKKYGLDISNYSNAELKNHSQQNLEEAIVRYHKGESGLHPDLSRSNYIEAGGRQNWVIIRQNELILRQNERIIQLLESMASAQGVAVPSTCSNCGSTTSAGTAFCSQCGHKLAD